jgi:hypothetical protein
MRAQIHRQAAGAIDDEDEVTAQFGDGAEGIGRGQRGNGLRIARRKKGALRAMETFTELINCSQEV